MRRFEHGLFFRCRVRQGLPACLTFALLCAALPGRSLADSPVRPPKAEEVVELKPFTVLADYPAIEVHFVLRGQNLFDPLDDPVVEARVVTVRFAGDDDGSSLKPHDVLLGFNGTTLSGVTLRGMAAMLTQARKDGTVVWRVRRGLGIMSIRHNGDWTPPLPGLER